jgi:hypothetical protein
VLVNVVAVVTTYNEQSKQQIFKEELVKAKGAEDWQQEKCLFIEIVR